MAVLKDSDLFDFEKYRAELAETGAAALSLAQSTEAATRRMRAAYDSTASQVNQIKQALGSLSTQQTDAASATFKSYSDQLDGLAKDAERYKALLKTLDSAQSASGFSIAEMTRLLSGLEREYKSLKPEQADYLARQKEIEGKVRAVSTVLNAQNQVLRDAKRATDAAEGSYDKLSRQTNELRASLRAMPDAFDKTTGAINKHNAAALEMQQIIERNDRILKTADATMGRHQRSVGDYGVALRGLGSEALQAAGGLIGISSALDVITSGLKIISDMERIDASLKAVSKDTADFKQTQEFLIATADRLGLQYEVLARSYKGLKAATNGTALEGKATQQIFTGLVNAGAALKLSNEEVEGALMAVTQMMSKGKVQAEELRGQLGERLPGALKILAEGMGVSEIKLNKMMEQGELLAVDVLPKLAKQLDKTYGKDAQNNLETMSGGWNVLTNQVHLFLAALNENGAISATANNFTKMIADVMKGLRVAIQSNDWKTFFGAMAIGPFQSIGNSARQQVANYAQNQTIVDEFKTMTPAQREARIGITKDNIARNEGRLKNEFGASVLGGKKPAIENQLKADRDLLILLRREDLKLQVKDRKDADQAEINAQRAADTKKEADKDRLDKERKKAEAARTKAQAEADRKLNDSLGKAKAGTDVQLAGLSADKQDGLISERDFIEKRQQITLDGIAERQSLLEKAGKKESDDYKQLTADKLDAETRYKRDSMKLALSDSKSATAGSLASLASGKADGSVSEADFVEQKKSITIAGLQDQQRILADAGQAESQLYKDIDNQILDATRDYYKERAKVASDAWKKELDETKVALKNVDNQLGEDYSARLATLTEYYDEKERRILVDQASQKITPDSAEIKLHELRMNRLKAELDLTESTYATDRSLSNALIDDKIAKLEAYKVEGVKTPKEIADAEAQIIKLKQAKEQEAADDKKKLDKDVADNAKKQSDETTQHEITNAEKAVQKRQQLWQAGLQLADTIGQSLFSVSDAYRQQESDSLDKQKENELKLAGDNADAKARIEENYNKRKAEIARKSAIAEREAALFSIAINTAQAVMSVLSTGGGAHYLDFGVTAGILSAFVTAAGIAQAAAVLAKPLPAYKYGKLETDSYTGPALAGEAGAELFVDREGYSQLLTKPTIINTKLGDRVFTASQTADILAETSAYPQTAERLRRGRLNEQIIIHQLAGKGSQSLSKRDAYEAFAKALDERPVKETNIDADGFKQGLRRANEYREYMEKRTAW